MTDNTTQPKRPSADQANTTGSNSRKRRYERPRILSREPLEAMAATCVGGNGKVQGFCLTARS